MAELKGRPTRMHMGSILVGSCLFISHIQNGSVIIHFGKPSSACLKQSAVHVNREAVMQADYLANWERLPNCEKLLQTV